VKSGEGADEQICRLSRELREIALVELRRDPGDEALRELLAATDGVLRQST
jgi:hypothetical protein